MLMAIGMAIGTLAMETLDGREIVMSNYDSRNGTVLVFMSSRCPVTQEMVASLLGVHEKYRRKEVLFVGLCANDAEKAEELKAFCQRNDVNLPVYRDRHGAIAARLGAQSTLEAFLLDSTGTLLYRGGFQDHGSVAEMDEAIARLLAHKTMRANFAKRQHPSEKRVGTPLLEPGVAASSADPIDPIEFAAEVVFDKVPWVADHHCSTIAEAPNGDLLCVWFGGSYECADDQVLFLARRKAGERTWSEPEVLTRGEYLCPPGNAVVFRVNPTRMMIFYDRMDEPRPIRNGRWKQGRLMRMWSDDNGLTWSKEDEVGLGVGGIRNAPLTLSTGALMLPISNPPSFLVTRDGGMGWETSGSIDAGGQPTAIERSNGSLMCFLRSEPFILQSESRDAGRTWSRTRRSQLPCPGAAIALCRLHNGHALLLYNPTALARTPLSVSLTKDDGATWSKPVHLESNPGEYAYPCVIETSDGKIHVSYTFLRKVIKHVEFNERWLEMLLP